MTNIIETVSAAHGAFLIFGLLIKCPLGAVHPDCPLHKLRTDKDLEGKFVYARQLSLRRLHALLEAHNACFGKRMQARHGDDTQRFEQGKRLLQRFSRVRSRRQWTACRMPPYCLRQVSDERSDVLISLGHPG